MNFKIDLHTHSSASSDGGITPKQYKHLLETHQLDYIAITDHNDIEIAADLNYVLGDKIIVGEEIMTSEGEIIGLFLSKKVEPGQTALKTIADIKAQNGIVYIPHPFETMRKGISAENLDKIANQIDVVEIYNGRAFAQDRSKQAVVWAKINKIAGVASSDAHGIRGVGRTYTMITDQPNRENLISLLANSTPIAQRPSIRGLLYPKYHRIKKKVKRSA